MTALLKQHELANFRSPRQRDKKHLEFVSRMPCVISGVDGVHVAHVRMGCVKRGKRPTGMQEKPDDRWTVPLAPEIHLYGQHSTNERLWWAEQCVDPLELAEELYEAFPDEEMGREIVMRHFLNGLDGRTENRREI